MMMFDMNASCRFHLVYKFKQWRGLPLSLGSGPSAFSAVIELVNLHDHHNIYQGGLDPGSIAVVSSNKTAVFVNWSYACSASGTASRLHNLSRYYFKTKINASMEELNLSDLFAILLIYADMVSVINQSDDIISLRSHSCTSMTGMAPRNGTTTSPASNSPVSAKWTNLSPSLGRIAKNYTSHFRWIY